MSSLFSLDEEERSVNVTFCRRGLAFPLQFLHLSAHVTLRANIKRTCFFSKPGRQFYFFCLRETMSRAEGEKTFSSSPFSDAAVRSF